MEDFTWSSGAWVVVMSLAMSVGAFVLLWVGQKYIERRNTPKSIVEGYALLEGAYMPIVHRCRELAEAVAYAAEIRRQLPAELRPVLDQVLMLARLYEQGCYEQAVAAGVVPKFWFGGPQDEKPITVPPPPLTPEVDEEDALAPKSNVVAFKRAAMRTHDWIAGQLVKRVG